ncbi:hypothetical protein TNIN_403181 [Trichonephila inaurata madagascariensis]|uniref:Uncharacterized protein n=1 Tax=Trichonephila inaurata madagascariensis TaxID=2747483 RepID=A0A8X6YFN7_9ARAC|nr:hypothetical protein TNIN_403181 [Trichonephila inaurata madagascariensis]
MYFDPSLKHIMCFNIKKERMPIPPLVHYTLSLFARSGVQLQQTDGGGGDVLGVGLRLRQHHALRSQHVLEEHLPGHHPAAGGPHPEEETGDRAEGEAE